MNCKITAHFLCDGHFTSINTCEMWEVKTVIQIFRKEFHTLRLKKKNPAVSFVRYNSWPSPTVLGSRVLNSPSPLVHGRGPQGSPIPVGSLIELGHKSQILRLRNMKTGPSSHPSGSSFNRLQGPALHSDRVQYRWPRI